MRNISKIKVGEFAQKLGLEILHAGTETIAISTVNINRPGLQLAGYYEHFGVDRIQIIGEMEFTYLKTFDPYIRNEALRKYYSHNFPCLIVSTNIEVFPEMIEFARQHKRVLLRSEKPTTQIMNSLIIYLNDLLAPVETRHGVLIDLYGVGVLITGHSGIGKSETALELVQRGHRLIADDAVIIKRINDRLIGLSPEIIRHFMEVRGVGVVDIRQMYGIGSVKASKVIDMVVMLEDWDNNKEYDRLGIANETEDVLGMRVPKITIPVKPGRNLAVILESAARNQKLKFSGYNPFEELERRTMANIGTLQSDE